MIKYVKLRDGAFPPYRAHASDAGADLSVCFDDYRSFADIAPGETRKIPTGIALAIPEGHVGIVTARSSARLRGLAIAGVVDAQYTGECFLIVTNTTNGTKRVFGGDRIAQLIVHAVLSVPFVEADALEATKRGSSGFGSSGAVGVRHAGNGG